MLPLLCLLALQDAPFDLADGDRVALVGNAFAERDLHYNHLETLLVSRLKDRSFQFRNLGWSGDTVFGHARSGFGSVEDGFKHLSRHLEELKPTVLLAAYGMNESFEGEKGLPDFRKGLARLLDRFAATGARVILLSPIRHEDLGRPLPDPAPHNRDLALYAGVLRDAARERGLRFVDLSGLDGAGQPLTDNGIHLNGHGYRRAAQEILRQLGYPPLPSLSLAPQSSSLGLVELKATDSCLPAGGERTVVIPGLAPGRWTLRDRATATAEEWARGVKITRGPEFEQAESLRKTIAEKNLLYFHYWRPQNDTYIFGFRKKEQGHLQPEIPQFLPLISQKEEAIAKLRLPVPQTYLLEREK